jgi:hypothetical protein
MSRPALVLHEAPVRRVRPPREQEAAAKKKIAVSVIVGSVVVHLILAIAAGIWIVARIWPPAPTKFVMKKDIRLPAQEREHRMNMAEFDALTPKPSFTDKIASLRPTNFALPDLPRVPMDQMLPLDPSALINDQVSSLVGAAGAGGGGDGGGSGLGGLGTGFSFMGVKSTGKRILLLFDVSQSVATKAAASGMPLSRIRDETATLLGKLPVTARFGLVQFTQNYKPFKTELVPASDPNRNAALQWLTDEWVETGMMGASGKVTSNPRGLVAVLELAAKMQPDVIFLISDGSFQHRPAGALTTIPWDDVKKVAKLITGAKMHFVGFQMRDDDRREMKTIVGRSGGRLRELK